MLKSAIYMGVNQKTLCVALDIFFLSEIARDYRPEYEAPQLIVSK